MTQERLKGESAKAYQAYLDYLHTGARRSLAKQIHKYKELLKSHPDANIPTVRLKTMGVWSSKYNWQVRIADKLVELEKVRDAEEKKAIQDMVKNHITQSRLMQSIGVKKMKELNEGDKMFINPKDALAYATEGMKSERIARGQPDTIQKVEGSVGAITFEDFAKVAEKMQNEKKKAD